MAYWKGNRHRETYTYRRVSWATFQETEDYGNVLDGRVELSEFSDLKASATFTFDGNPVPDETDLIRVYYSFTDDYGASEQVCLGTFFVANSGTTYRAVYKGGEDTGLTAKGTIEGASVLKVLLDRITGAPLTIPAGTNIVTWATAQIEALGLRVTATEAAYTLSAAYTFEAGQTMLTVINEALSWAGFAGCHPDAMGNVVLSKYVEPTKRIPVWTFANDGESIMYPDVERTHDWADTPNVARLSYESETECLTASASNVDPLSAVSLPRRGNRETTYYEAVVELSGATQGDRLNNLIDMAKRRLVSQSADIEYVNISHAYVPVDMGDAIAVDYSDVSWSGTAVGLSINLKPGTRADLRVRSYTAAQMQITAEGSVVWTQ